MTAFGDPILPLGDCHTPLGDDERRGLKLSNITTRGELNEAEQANILRCRQRLRQPTLEELLDDRYLRQLHSLMFGEVWEWAGAYRRLETSIGIDPAQISVSVRDLVADAMIWAQHEEPQSIAVRFHHRLVWIHLAIPGVPGHLFRLIPDTRSGVFGHPERGGTLAFV